MTINILVRKNSLVIVTEAMIQQALNSREPGETVNVDIHPGAEVIVAEDGETAKELKELLDSTD